MAKCTKCNKEITSLESIVPGVLMYNINLDKQGDLQYEQHEFEPDADIAEYLCPECGEALFTSKSEAEATDFLKGE